jgi:hypothetical protein
VEELGEDDDDEVEGGEEEIIGEEKFRHHIEIRQGKILPLRAFEKTRDREEQAGRGQLQSPF